jgi:hypothetical protein
MEISPPEGRHYARLLRNPRENVADQQYQSHDPQGPAKAGHYRYDRYRIAASPNPEILKSSNPEILKSQAT